ncbi:S8 family serine peptidase [Paenibacillus alvei]|uniref:S8 family serine peptidase n=1 Tax=Paenibacillus alvei TaxID=44250 RepID=UPI0013DC3048|nr:S8 family serine peptidase [Paenibacillus alvei]NEZ40174.1 S8 family serine peptidase [Paenibacillus alvei]
MANKNNKKVLSLIMSIAMAISLMSPAVSAYEGSANNSTEKLLHLRSGTINLQNENEQYGLQFDEESTQRQLYVVQFNDVITDSSKQLLQQAGAELGDYLPDYAYLVRMNSQQAAILATNDQIYRITLFQPEWKNGNLSTSEDIPTSNYVISVFRGSEAEVAQSLQQQAIPVTDVQDGYIEAVVSNESLPLVLHQPDVTFVESKPADEIFNDFVTNQVEAATSNGVWSKGLTGKGQVVTVADSGLDSGNLSTLHKDFEGQLHTAPVPIASGTWTDTNGHGTHVAGTVLSTGAMSNGKYKGVAYGAKLFFQALGCGGDSICTGDVRNLFSAAKQQGSAIHTNSWGSRFNYTYNANSSRVDEFTFNDKNFTVLFAAGNDGRGGYKTVNAPGNAKNTITVGNLQKSNPNQIAVGSSKGYTLDGRVKPDVVVTGSNIISVRSSASSTPANPNQYYTTMSGTSMATPAVAGSAAIVREFYTENKHITPSSALIKATLINGAEDVGYGWMSRETGWGQVNLVNSLTPAEGRTNDFIDNTTGLKTNDSISYRVKAEADKPLKISLVWSDYQGAVQAGKQLVNDLDLEVKAPTGELYKGNCFVQNTASTSCTNYDDINNVENVYLSTPTTGEYTVTIKGHNVPQGPQSFALVVSGNRSSILGQAPENPEPIVLKAPEQLAVTAVTYNSVNLSWSDPNTGIQGLTYEIYQQQQKIGTSSQTNYTVKDLSPGNTYTFTVRIIDGQGNVSPDSQSVTAKLSKPEGNTEPWQIDKPYKISDLVSYSGVIYACMQPHTSLDGWEPSNVPALWSPVQE